MKTIHVIFEDGEFKALAKVKGTKSWHNFVMELAKPLSRKAEEL